MNSNTKTVGRNANLLFGVTPDRRGLIPDWQEKVLKEFGPKIKLWYGNSVKELSGKGRKFMFPFTHPEKLNYVIILEEIKLGERIRSWRLEGITKGSVRHIAQGQSIGHKRILLFKPGSFEKVQFIVEKDVHIPVIKNITTGLIKDKVLHKIRM